MFYTNGASFDTCVKLTCICRVPLTLKPDSSFCLPASGLQRLHDTTPRPADTHHIYSNASQAETLSLFIDGKPSFPATALCLELHWRAWFDGPARQQTTVLVAIWVQLTRWRSEELAADSIFYWRSLKLSSIFREDTAANASQQQLFV